MSRSDCSSANIEQDECPKKHTKNQKSYGNKAIKRVQEQAQERKE